jgi:hypothetical protein
VCERSRAVIRLDGARLAPAESSDEVAVLPVCTLRAQQPIAEIEVVARSLIDLLARALAGDYTLAPVAMLLADDPRLWDGASHAAPLVERLENAHTVVRGRGLFGLIEHLEMRVGDATWRRFVQPPAWGKTHRIDLGTEWLTPMIDLGDGRVLAQSWRTASVAVLDLAAITASRPDKRKRTEVVSTQPAAQVSVVGRCLVDVLTFALDHGRLPDAVRMLADPA